MLIVDSSALIAVFELEPEVDAIERVLAAADAIEIAAPTFVEAGTVLALRYRRDPSAALDRLSTYLARARIAVAQFDEAQARAALHARIRFGRGLGGPGKLNLGDTFAYALAKVRNAPLLFVGDDFRATDIVSALD